MNRPSSNAEEAAGVGAAAEERLYLAISGALLRGQLRPGTPLRERYLAEEFGVTRGLVRKVLLRLGREGKLDLHVNRGAYVPQPTRGQVIETYSARKALEVGMLALLASEVTSAQLARLQSHLEAELEASRYSEREHSIRLAGDFHLLVAELLGNRQLSEMLDHLVSRTRMYVALFEPTQDSGCAPHEHRAIVDALSRHDVAGAIHAMLAHLGQVEARVLSHVDSSEPAPVADILRTVLKEHT